MKLSQAIRAGARKTRAIKGGFFDGDGGACALGAMAIGAGVGNDIMQLKMYLESGMFRAYFPEITMMKECPVCCVYDWSPAYTPGRLIVHFNDDHSWSRERIAGWIESHVEVPTYSMLQMQEFMENPGPVLAEVK